MSTKRRSIRLFEHEERLLQELYLSHRIPIDQYELRPATLQAFTEEWNARTGRNDSSGDLIHFMKTRRKSGKWVRFDGNHRIAPITTDEFSDLEVEVLVGIYRELVISKNVGSDALAYDEELALRVAREFESQTTRKVPAHILTAKLTQLRKRGYLPLVSEGSHVVELNAETGFADIDDILVSPPKDTRS